MGGKLLKFLLRLFYFWKTQSGYRSRGFCIFIIAAFALPSAMILNFQAYDHQGKDYKRQGKALAKSPVAPKTRMMVGFTVSRLFILFHLKFSHSTLWNMFLISIRS
jgi:hypothetical protein